MDDTQELSDGYTIGEILDKLYEEVEDSRPGPHLIEIMRATPYQYVARITQEPGEDFEAVHVQ